MWNLLKDKVRYIDWCWFFSFLGWIALALLIFMLFSFSIADKKVRDYYTGAHYSESGIAYRVMADIDWCADLAVFTSPNQEETLKFYRELKQRK